MGLTAVVLHDSTQEGVNITLDAGSTGHVVCHLHSSSSSHYLTHTHTHTRTLDWRSGRLLLKSRMELSTNGMR